MSVIVPVREGGGMFAVCLAHLASCDPPPEETIVVADGPGDGAWRAAEQAGCRVLHQASPKGAAAARNMGALAARGDILLFVDADVAVPPGIIGALRGSFAGHPEASAIFGSYDDCPAAPGFISQYKNLLNHYVHQHGREEASTFWTACGGVRREAFFRVRGFDERLQSMEDIDLGYRLREQGFRIRLDKSLRVQHLKRWTVSSMVWTDFVKRALPWTALILRQGGTIDDLNVSRSGRVSVALACLMALCAGAAPVARVFLVPAALCAAVLLVIHAPLYRFFRVKRGLVFALGVVPWHWFYFLYSGAGFGLACAMHMIRPREPCFRSAVAAGLGQPVDGRVEARP